MILVPTCTSHPSAFFLELKTQTFLLELGPDCAKMGLEGRRVTALLPLELYIENVSQLENP